MRAKDWSQAEQGELNPITPCDGIQPRWRRLIVFGTRVLFYPFLTVLLGTGAAKLFAATLSQRGQVPASAFY